MEDKESRTKPDTLTVVATTDGSSHTLSLERACCSGAGRCDKVCLPPIVKAELAIVEAAVNVDARAANMLEKHWRI